MSEDERTRRAVSAVIFGLCRLNSSALVVEIHNETGRGRSGTDRADGVTTSHPAAVPRTRRKRYTETLRRSYSISSATRSAIEAPATSSTTCSARSRPEVTPPAVTMSPSSTNRAPSTT
jgi:hypothetical protein